MIRTLRTRRSLSSARAFSCIITFCLVGFPLLFASASGPTPVFLPQVNYSSGGSYANSVAVADLNGDGIPDIVVVNCYCGRVTGVGTLGDVVMELGNSLYQKSADRYIAVRPVPIEKLQRAWRNTLGLRDPPPIYENIY